MKNIGILVPSLKNGGAERAAANLTKDLSKYYNIYLIVFDNQNITYDYDGTLISIDRPPMKTKIGKILNIIIRSIKTRRIKKLYKLDCCISLLEGANIVNVLSKNKEKIITSERCLVSFMHNNLFSKLEMKFIEKKTDLIVALSNMVKKELIEYYKIDEKKVLTIYNSCEKDRLVNKMENYKEYTEKRYIMTMGRLEYQKGQWHLIKAFKKVNEKLPNVELIILGQGILKEKLELLSKKLGISDNIKFPGYIVNPHEILKRSEIFVFPSIAEGLGNVLLEALAFNKAIISTDCDAGPREILAPDTDITIKTKEIEYAKYGVLVPSFDKKDIDIENLELSKEEEKMAEAIIKLLENEEIRKKYEKYSEERIKDFSTDKIGNEWIQVIEKLMKG